MEQIAMCRKILTRTYILQGGASLHSIKNNDVNNQIEWLKAHNVPVFNQWIRQDGKEKKVNTFAKMPLVEYSVRCGATWDYKNSYWNIWRAKMQKLSLKRNAHPMR